MNMVFSLKGFRKGLVKSWRIDTNDLEVRVVQNSKGTTTVGEAQKTSRSLAGRETKYPPRAGPALAFLISEEQGHRR